MEEFFAEIDLSDENPLNPDHMKENTDFLDLYYDLIKELILTVKSSDSTSSDIVLKFIKTWNNFEGCKNSSYDDYWWSESMIKLYGKEYSPSKMDIIIIEYLSPHFLNLNKAKDFIYDFSADKRIDSRMSKILEPGKKFKDVDKEKYLKMKNFFILEMKKVPFEMLFYLF